MSIHIKLYNQYILIKFSRNWKTGSNIYVNGTHLQKYEAVSKN